MVLFYININDESSDSLTAEFNVTLYSVFKTHQLQDLINELKTNLSADIHITSKGKGMAHIFFCVLTK